MRLPKVLRRGGLMALVAVFMVSCASAPTQEMADARQALEAAGAAGAPTHAATNLDAARGFLAQAERALEGGDYGRAREEAVAAKRAAVAARNIAIAIGEAVAALEQAQRLGFQWRDSQALLEQAKAAARAGDETQAVTLATQVRFQSDAAVRQHDLEHARATLDALAAHQGAMSESQRARYDAARQALRDQDGRRADDLARALSAELTAPGDDHYVVVPGDHLWGISAKPTIYGNPYHWPLLYKANSHQIRDPDLIHPGQDLTIRRAWDRGEVDAAVTHARNRGGWAVGVIEAVDRGYLGR